MTEGVQRLVNATASPCERVAGRGVFVYLSGPSCVFGRVCGDVRVKDKIWNAGMYGSCKTDAGIVSCGPASGHAASCNCPSRGRDADHANSTIRIEKQSH